MRHGKCFFVHAMNASRPLLLPTLVVLSACADAARTHSCTEIGCSDGVALDVGAPSATHPDALPLTLHVCLDGACDDATIASATECHRTATNGKDSPLPPLVVTCIVDHGSVVLRASTTTSGLASGAHDVTLAVKGASGTELYHRTAAVNLSESRPNGPSCEPLCRQGSVVMRE